MGVKVVLWELLYFLSLGLTVSAASKVGGALLVFCHLVVAPGAALLLVRWFPLVLPVAAGLAVVSTLAGLIWSFERDLPTNQAIAAVSCILFGLAASVTTLRRLLRLKRKG